MTSAQDVFAKVKTKEERVRILLDPNLADLHAELSTALEAAEDEEKRAIAEQILALEDEIAAAEVEFLVQGMGRARWRKLKADHPPTEEGALYDDEFQFVAMSECLVEPEMTVDELKRLNELVTEIQWIELWSAVQLVNIGSGSAHPESLAARATVASADGKSKPRSNSGLAAAS